jgi:beta-lactamase class D
MGKPGTLAVLLACSVGCVPALSARSPAPVSARAECVMMMPLDGSVPYVSDPAECSVRTAPASTFKIPHALIALQTGALSSPRDVLSWDGSQQPFPSWESDHSLHSGIRSSVVWFFRRTAARIGPARMSDWLTRLGYGADTFDGDPTMFWLNGDLIVSPVEQLDFMLRLYRYEVPADREAVDAVKSALLMPPGTLMNAAGSHDFTLTWPGPLAVSAKTGNTRVGEESVSWVVGHIAHGGREFVFVGRVRSRDALPGTAGAELARRALDSIGPDASGYGR